MTKRVKRRQWTSLRFGRTGAHHRQYDSSSNRHQKNHGSWRKSSARFQSKKKVSQSYRIANKWKTGNKWSQTVPLFFKQSNWADSSPPDKVNNSRLTTKELKSNASFYAGTKSALTETKANVPSFFSPPWPALSLWAVSTASFSA